MEFRSIKEDTAKSKKKSKNLALSATKRVYSEEEARVTSLPIKKEHYKATHNCSAFIIVENVVNKHVREDMVSLVAAGVPMLGVYENLTISPVSVWS